MNRRALILTAVVSSTLPAHGFAQTTFLKHLGGAGVDRGVTVVETGDGGYVITGYTTGSGAGGEDVLLMRTDANGNTIWTKTFGGTGLDNGWAVRQTEDGGFIVAGFTDSFGAGGMDVYLIRTDAAGDTLWTKTFGGPDDEHGWDVRITATGGFIIAAETGSFGHGELDAFLIKTDADGNEEWARAYGGERIDRVFSVQEAGDGGYAAAGITYSFTSVNADDRDAYLLKTDASGDLEWYRTFGGDAYDVGHSIAVTRDGGYLITGYGESFSEHGNRDVYLIKTDALGEEQWTNVYGRRGNERGIKGQQTKDGGYVATGFTDENGDVYLVRTDDTGEALWTRTFGTADRVDFGYTVQETRDGGYVVTGHSQTRDGSAVDVLLIKTDSEGNVRP